MSYAALIWVERQALKDLERKPVARCIKDCPAGEEITEGNVQEYFELVLVAEELSVTADIAFAVAGSTEG